jgi:glycosyltransferase involved in cell wall biosynthesis
MEKHFPSYGNRYWMDVATLLRATGNPTGIPRTVAMLLGGLLANRAVNLRLCWFHSRLRNFTEVVIRDYGREDLKNHAPGRAAGNNGRPRSGTPRKAVSATQAGPEWLLKLYYSLPYDFRPAASSLYRLTLTARGWIKLRSALEWAVASFNWLKQLAPWTKTDPLLRLDSLVRVRKRSKRLQLRPSDVVISAGRPWAEPIYPGAVGDLRRSAGFKLVSFVYDVIAVKFPQFVRPDFPPVFRQWFIETLRCSDLIVTISENSRRDILALANETATPAPQVVVIRLGDDIPTGGGVRGEWEGFSPFERYVLSVGTLEVRKNHLLLYQVWRRLIETHGSLIPKLVIAGQDGWLAGDLLFQVRNDPLTRDRILVLPSVSDEELVWLYQNCLLTAFPSFYEGWGLPVAESLCHGKYCIASNSSSVPEIAGDLIDYHDPYSFEQCLGLTTRALFDERFRAEREAAIRARYRPYSWAQCADSLLTILANHFANPSPPAD